MKSLRGRTVVITGASGGIGRAAAVAFTRRGSNLVLAARGGEQLQGIASELAGKGVQALAVSTDVTDFCQAQRLHDACLERFGRIDVLVNGAGAGLVGAFSDTPLEEARRLVEVNLLGSATMMKAVLQTKERQGAGVTINIASTAGVLPGAYMAIYHASKSALVSLSESVNLEYLGSGI